MHLDQQWIRNWIQHQLRGTLFSFRGSRRTLVFLSPLIVLLLGGCKWQFGWGYNGGYSPDQPIPFSHQLHVGENKMQCLYCHNQTERSVHANIPALSTCMNCHLLVKTDSPHIQKLREAYDKGDSIPWVKVHMLPDHVKFNHAAHLSKGVNCEQCHGPIQTMAKVYQYQDLSMGWCVNCHRNRETEDALNTNPSNKTPLNKAPVNCSTCHH